MDVIVNAGSGTDDKSDVRQQLAELLPFIGQLRRMQQGAKRAAHAAARA